MHCEYVIVKGVDKMIIDCKKYAGECSCGRVHQMYTEKAIIEAGALENFEEYLQSVGLAGRKAIVYDTNTYDAKGLVRLRGEQKIILEAKDLHADEKAVDLVLSQLDKDIEILVAVGAGTIHDVTRYCAQKLGIPFVACPTAASVDGFCSTVSAMTWNGYKKTMPGVAPKLVIADINVIKNAPIALALSGVGDILGKFTSLADWNISHVLTGEFLCTVIEDITREAVIAVMKCGENIKENGDSDAFVHLTRALLLSGLAMQMMGNSRPASGAEHHISHLIELELPYLNIENSASHGEKVGVAMTVVSDIYHKLGKIEDITPYVKPFIPLEPKEMEEIFGVLVNSVWEENAKDCLREVTGESLIKNWSKVRDIIKEIPKKEELLELYKKIGAKKAMPDIGIGESDIPKLLYISPCIRNRLTLMRIRRMLTI